MIAWFTRGYFRCVKTTCRKFLTNRGKKRLAEIETRLWRGIFDQIYSLMYLIIIADDGNHAIVDTR